MWIMKFTATRYCYDSRTNSSFAIILITHPFNLMSHIMGWWNIPSLIFNVESSIIFFICDFTF
ncbi:hypothetical protein BLOT_009233 [Blomia tropicalis]|nr:hypothetical protein BLOT_009233 [Blomia tropicalis]